jgi:hypothetical protein
LWRDFVPVAFHVDYWDRLGWPDLFASAANTQRQRSYAAEWGAGSVYTPGFVINGREVEGRPSIDRLRSEKSESPGRLIVEQDSGDDATLVTARFEPGDAFNGGEVEVVLLGFNQQSEVRRGENAGRNLRHDFVALWSGKAALTNESGKGWTGAVRIPASLTKRNDSQGRSELGVAVWITTGKDQVPIQVAGGMLR